MRPEAELWWKQGLEDLDTAVSNLSTKKYYAAAFFCQQAAEKALKAVYIEAKREQQPKTHNLLDLGKLLKVPRNILDALIELNPEYVVTRYPDAANGLPAEMYNEEIAKRKIEKARKVMAWARQKLTK